VGPQYKTAVMGQALAGPAPVRCGFDALAGSAAERQRAAAAQQAMCRALRGGQEHAHCNFASLNQIQCICLLGYWSNGPLSCRPERGRRPRKPARRTSSVLTGRAAARAPTRSAPQRAGAGPGCPPLPPRARRRSRKTPKGEHRQAPKAKRRRRRRRERRACARCPIHRACSAPPAGRAHARRQGPEPPPRAPRRGRGPPRKPLSWAAPSSSSSSPPAKPRAPSRTATRAAAACARAAACAACGEDAPPRCLRRSSYAASWL
jgi:hypothetical protein